MRDTMKDRPRLAVLCLRARRKPLNKPLNKAARSRNDDGPDR
ncbi:hypothetical protein J2S46_003872 [Kitasatospora herbaricolor]|nr:hypothetical protein [Kitasatospora herbaricolor]MDQ0309316.1 hypothetical protein [Kitasatospora herbaricolor]